MTTTRIVSFADGRSLGYRSDFTTTPASVALTLTDADGGVLWRASLTPPGGSGTLSVMGAAPAPNGAVTVYFHREQFIQNDDGTLFGQSFAADGTASAAEVVSEQGHLFPRTAPALLTLSDGTLLYGTDVLSSPDPDAGFFGSRVYPTSFLNQLFPYAQALAETQTGFVWATMSNNDAVGPVRLHLFTPGLQRITTDIGVGSGVHQGNGDFAARNEAVDVATLSDGRIVVAWTTERTPDGGGTPVNGIWYAIHAADGSAVLPEAAAPVQGGGQVQEAPRVFALEGGGFALAFQNRQQGNSSFNADIFVQTYDNTGAFVAELRFPRISSAPHYTLDTGDLGIAPDGAMFWFTDTGTRVEADLALPPPGPAQGTPGDDVVTLTDGADAFDGLAGNDSLMGLAGNDTLNGGDGTDTLDGGAGDDFLFGGSATTDLRDLIYGGIGHDSIDGGWGNDELHGGDGNDTILGGFGSDTVIGNAGNDLLAGGAGSDLMFAGPGDDTLNGGFGYDRLNGSEGADRFFHQGVADHASDWIQDYNAAEGDLLVFGLAGASRAQFQVNVNTTPGAGSGDVEEAFIIYRPTGQIMWALVDGDAQDQINLLVGGQVVDLLG